MRTPTFDNRASLATVWGIQPRLVVAPEPALHWMQPRSADRPSSPSAHTFRALDETYLRSEPSMCPRFHLLQRSNGAGPFIPWMLRFTQPVSDRLRQEQGMGTLAAKACRRTQERIADQAKDWNATPQR